MLSKTIDRLSLVLSMKENAVDISLLQDYGSDALDKLCKGIEEHKLNPAILSNCIAIQKELLNNERFFFYLDKLTAAKIGSAEANLYLSELHTCGCYGIDYPVNRLISSMALAKYSAALFCDYLRYFSGMKSDKEQKSNIISNLKYFTGSLDKPLSELTEAEKLLFMESCLTNRSLIPKEFSRALELLQQKGVLEIVRFINDNEYDVSLNIDNYEAISKDSEAIFKYFKHFRRRLSKEHMELLIERWLDNNCYLYDLDMLWSKADKLSGDGTSDALNDHSGYINLIYGNSINGITLAIVPRHKEDILIHAVAQGKSGFLRLLEENKELFESIGEQSILYCRDFYGKHLDLDTMNAEYLRDCIQMEACLLRFGCLERNRSYTFNEIKAVYGLPAQYYKLYAALNMPTENRLPVFKQLSDKRLLAFIDNDERIRSLAAKLSQKPLSEWLSNELAHIEGLTMLDAVRLLVDYDEVSKLIPRLKNLHETQLLIRNKASAQNYATIADMEKDLDSIDGGWTTLVEQLGFSSDFLLENKRRVQEFLCKGNAEIAGVYYEHLYDNSRKELFKQIIEAELSGGLSELKYNAEELRSQIDFPLSTEQQSVWQVNTEVHTERISVYECDDFNSAMTLGCISSRAHLSYIDGNYCECLLSGFDGNKKVLVASVDNINVGNAVISLTKCRFEKQCEAEQERLCILLKRSYASEVSAETKAKIEDMYFELMDTKAEKMGAMLVLSASYGTMERPDLIRDAFDIYIPETKAGVQYLDSLSSRGGRCYDSCYKTSDFIIRTDAVYENGESEDLA